MFKKVMAAALATALCAGHTHAGENVTLTLGRLGPSISGAFIEQQITVTNNTNQIVQTVEIECGFFHGAQLVDTTRMTARNIPPSTQAYVSVIADRKNQPDSAKCRIYRVD